MNIEDYFIKGFKNSHIGDDGAVIGEYIYSKDAFFENVHFKRSWMSLYQIAYKSMIVNISDAIAMNAKPLYALLAVAMPKLSLKELDELTCGFKDAAKKFNIEIIGGDTIANCKLDISVTIVSKSKKPLLRRGLKPNHLLAYSGVLGNSKKDLKKLLYGGKIHKQSKFVNSTLRDKFVYDIASVLSCAMDISDGLFSDLNKLSKVNSIGFNFHNVIPKRVGCSGEEYEMLFGFDGRFRKKVLRIAQKNRVKVSVFATAKRKKYQNSCKANHF
ncbi:MAG: thiamine-phosphate kinase [Campylobacterota bacterium]|nr:thiamine-phosphate kinase [Campylobacterota bacterium]